MQDENEQAEWAYTPDSSQAAYDGESMGQQPVTDAVVQPVTWTASEYIAHEKSASWYLALFAAGGVLTVIIYLVTRDVLASFAVFFASAAMAVYAGRRPDTKTYKVDEKGVTVDQKFYPYNSFRSFSVVEEGAIDSVWLKPLKRFAPVVVMYFAPDQEDNIASVLATFLPHEQRELDAIDRFSKRIRF